MERIAVPATECARITPKFLDGERKALGERWFRPEYLCEFVETDDALFDGELVDEAFTRDVRPLWQGR